MSTRRPNKTLCAPERPTVSGNSPLRSSHVGDLPQTPVYRDGTGTDARSEQSLVSASKRDQQRALAADHRPRTLHGEPRLCRADEREQSDAIKRRERDSARDDVIELLASMTGDLELLRTRIRQIPGNHRDNLRMVDRGLKSLARTVDS
jgi:hypothetical protein